MYHSRAFAGTKSLLAKAAAAAATATTTTTAGSTGGKGKGGFNMEYPVSPAMSKFLGVSEISRSQAVKKIWDYVKTHQLQNPENKRVIFCDDKLKTIFAGKTEVGMLEIGKLLSPHFTKSK